MKLIYSAPDPLAVHAVRGFLESHGISTCVVGAERPSMAGLVPPTECWVELHIYDDQSEEQARKLVEHFLHSKSGGTKWTCPVCGEQNDAKFTDCWRCAQRPAAGERGEGAGIVVYAACAAGLLLLGAPILLPLALGTAHPPLPRVLLAAGAVAAAVGLLFRAGAQYAARRRRPKNPTTS